MMQFCWPFSWPPVWYAYPMQLSNESQWPSHSFCVNPYSYLEFT